MSLLSALQEQAIRLKRTSWDGPGMTQALADELYLMLTNATGPTTGPVATQQPGSTPMQLGPYPSLNFPAIDLPQLLLNPPTDTNPNGLTQTPGPGNEDTKTETQWLRIATPGVITSADGSSATYGVAVYPNGLGGKSATVQALQLDGNKGLSVGQKGLVAWIWELEVKTRTTKNQDGAITNTQTELKVKSQSYYMSMGASGGGGMPGVVVSLDSDPGDGTQTYNLTVYPNGLKDANGNAVAGQSVVATQLQIAAGAVLPEGTWVLVAKAGGAYYMQFPVAA